MKKVLEKLSQEEGQRLYQKKTEEVFFDPKVATDELVDEVFSVVK